MEGGVVILIIVVIIIVILIRLAAGGVDYSRLDQYISERGGRVIKKKLESVRQRMVWLRARENI
jgi:hypothetical protein